MGTKGLHKGSRHHWAPRRGRAAAALTVAVPKEAGALPSQVRKRLREGEEAARSRSRACRLEPAHEAPTPSTTALGRLQCGVGPRPVSLGNEAK